MAVRVEVCLSPMLIARPNWNHVTLGSGYDLTVVMILAVRPSTPYCVSSGLPRNSGMIPIHSNTIIVKIQDKQGLTLVVYHKSSSARYRYTTY